MRSTLITVVTGVASMLLVAQVAAADAVQEQLRLMEQRMAEMEDRLSSTSTQLEAAEAKLEQRDATLVEHGLLEEDDSALRSGVGDFVEMVDISGVVAASYNHRLINSSVPSNDNENLFKTPDANTFQVDQVWLTLDKAPTDESRGGFHAEFFTGQSANSQNGTGDDTVSIYSAYVSYLVPVGNGIQIDAGRLGTPLGAEVVQTNGNFFITQGSVFGLQPVTYTGVSASTQITDELGFTAGVVNEVYSNTFDSPVQDKAYYGQLSYGGDLFGLNVGGIWGRDSTNCGNGGTGECNTSVVDVVLSADPTDNLSLWANFDWKHSGGDNTPTHGDAFGISGAGRLAVTETVGVATRVEYISTEDTLNGTADDNELVTLTGTVDVTLAEGLVARTELRWDTLVNDFDGGRFEQGRNDQLVGLAQIYYEF